MPTPQRRRARLVRLRRGAKAAKPVVVKVQRARSAPPPDPTGAIEVRLFDGTRRPAAGVKALVRLIDGRQQRVHEGTHPGPTIRFTGLHVADNLDDRYVVLVSVDGFAMTGFTPVVIRRGEITRVDLMLIPESNHFDFSDASWTALSDTHPNLVAFLSNGAAGAAAARARYEALMADQPRSLACLLNIWTAMEAIFLADGTPVDYLKQLDWTTVPPAPDRFFCYADPDLVTEVVQAASKGVFDPEPNPQVFHHGATRSYKQVQFGEANVQLTFHENDTRTIDGVACVLVEPDIDFYKDLLAHGLLEVIPGQITPPEQAYALRWIAGQQAGIPPFDPPFTIVAAPTRAMSVALHKSRGGVTRDKALPRRSRHTRKHEKEDV